MTSKACSDDHREVGCYCHMANMLGLLVLVLLVIVTAADFSCDYDDEHTDQYCRDQAGGGNSGNVNGDNCHDDGADSSFLGRLQLAVSAIFLVVTLYKRRHVSTVVTGQR